MSPWEKLSQRIVAAFRDKADRTGVQRPLAASEEHVCARHSVSLRILQEAAEIYGRQHAAPPRWILEHGKVTVFPRPGEWGNHRGPRRG